MVGELVGNGADGVHKPQWTPASTRDGDRGRDACYSAEVATVRSTGVPGETNALAPGF